MRRRKVFENVQANGRVVTQAEVAKDYDKFPVVRDEDINWGLRVQVNKFVFILDKILMTFEFFLIWSLHNQFNCTWSDAIDLNEHFRVLY